MNIPDTYTHWDKDNQQFANVLADTDRFWPLSDDLTWLALRCDNWVEGPMTHISRGDNGRYCFTTLGGWNPDRTKGGLAYTRHQWLTRRRELGLEELEVTPEEDAMWEELEARQNDSVNSPSHYTQGGVECIDAIESALTPEEFRGFCKGNALKYIWRERHKGGEESIAKAEWYLDKL